MASRLAFVAEWLDPSSGVLWRYQLFFYPDTNEVEMFDIKNRRHFLKRIKYDSLSAGQLYPGATVTVFARQLIIQEFGDEATRRAVEVRAERTLAMIKPDAFRHAGQVLQVISGSGLQVANLRMAHLSRADAEEFYAVHAGAPFFDKLVSFMSSGPVVAMELVGPGAISRWRALLGPTDSARARSEVPQSVRAVFGTDNTRNAAHGSDAPATAAQELAFFFGPGRTAVGRCAVCGSGSSLAVVKPHLVREGAAGQALEGIQEHFDVTAMQLVRMDRPAAAELLEVYKGVLPPGEFSAAVEELSSGPCLAVEVRAPDGSNAVEPLRQLVGPSDPEMGRTLRPDSLRARFGTSRVRNGIHCTDLPEDGELETSFIFASEFVK